MTVDDKTISDFELIELDRSIEDIIDNISYVSDVVTSLESFCGFENIGQDLNVDGNLESKRTRKSTTKLTKIGSLINESVEIAEGKILDKKYH